MANPKKPKFDPEHISMIHSHGLDIANRIIYLDSEAEDGEVSYDMSRKFLRNIKVLEVISESEPLTIVLNTDGGDVVQGMAIYDRIRESPCDVTIKVYGYAQSMGSVILQAGDHRVLAPHAEIMFHFGTVENISGNPHEVKSQADREIEIARRVDKILYRRIKAKADKDNRAMPESKYQTMNFRGKYMGAEEAVEMGLADEIEQPYRAKEDIDDNP